MQKTGLSRLPVLDTFPARDYDRISSLYTCQQSVKGFFDIYLAVKMERYHCFPVPAFTLLAWNLGILNLLSTFSHPAWDLVWANETISFGSVLELLSSRYSEARTVLGFDSHNHDSEDMCSHMVKKLQWVKASHESKFGITAGTAQTDNLEPSDLEMPDFMESLLHIDNFEDQWMQDLLGRNY